jgi:hypothetical protein
MAEAAARSSAKTASMNSGDSDASSSLAVRMVDAVVIQAMVPLSLSRSAQAARGAAGAGPGEGFAEPRTLFVWAGSDTLQSQPSAAPSNSATHCPCGRPGEVRQRLHTRSARLVVRPQRVLAQILAASGPGHGPAPPSVSTLPVWSESDSRTTVGTRKNSSSHSPPGAISP